MGGLGTGFTTLSSVGKGNVGAKGTHSFCKKAIRGQGRSNAGEMGVKPELFTKCEMEDVMENLHFRFGRCLDRRKPYLANFD